VPVVLAGEEHDHAVLGEQLHDVLGAIEVDVVAVGPMQAADGADVLEFPDTMFQRCEPCFEVGHGAPPALVCFKS